MFLVTLGPKLPCRFTTLHFVWLSLVIDIIGVPAFLRNFFAWIAGTVVGDELFANTARASRKKDVAEYYKLMKEKVDYAVKFQKEVCTEIIDTLCRALIGIFRLDSGLGQVRIGWNYCTCSSRPSVAARVSFPRSQKYSYSPLIRIQWLR